MDNTPKGLVIEHPVSIRQRAYDYLRDEILSGRIEPGARLIEGRLAGQIGVSRTPIREALHILEREGLLESIPRVGYRVKALEWDEVEEICEIRAVNETLAASWALQRMTLEQFEDLKKNLRLSENEVRKGNPKAFVELDAEFHEILARASGSKRLLELCQLLRRHMLRYRIESIFSEENVLRAVKGHRRIVDCIGHKDSQKVEKAVRAHLEQSKRDIRRYAFGIDGKTARPGE